MNNLTKHYYNKFNINSLENILDVGPGYKSDGLDIKKINNSINVDILEGDNEVIEYQLKNKDIDLVVKADFSKDDFHLISDLKKYDIIFCYEVIEHVKNPSLFLKKLRFLLKENGAIFLSCPTRYSEQIIFKINSNYNKNTLYPHVNFFSKRAIFNLCNFNDLRVVHYKVINFSYLILHIIINLMRLNHNTSDGKIESKYWRYLHFIFAEIPRIFEKLINYKISSIIGRNQFFLIKLKND